VLPYIDTSTAPGKATADSDIVEARFVELLPGVRAVQAVDFVSDDPANAGTMAMSWELTAVDAATRVGIRAEHVPAWDLRGGSRRRAQLLAGQPRRLARALAQRDLTSQTPVRISAETREGSEQLQADWKLERLPIAYGLTEPSMREWACSSRGAGATTNRRFSTSH
jgi:hypothetical protein